MVTRWAATSFRTVNLLHRVILRLMNFSLAAVLIIFRGLYFGVFAATLEGYKKLLFITVTSQNFGDISSMFHVQQLHFGEQLKFCYFEEFWGSVSHLHHFRNALNFVTVRSPCLGRINSSDAGRSLIHPCHVAEGVSLTALRLLLLRQMDLQLHCECWRRDAVRNGEM